MLSFESKIWFNPRKRKQSEKLKAKQTIPEFKINFSTFSQTEKKLNERKAKFLRHHCSSEAFQQCI